MNKRAGGLSFGSYSGLLLGLSLFLRVYKGNQGMMTMDTTHTLTHVKTSRGRAERGSKEANGGAQVTVSLSLLLFVTPRTSLSNPLFLSTRRLVSVDLAYLQFVHFFSLFPVERQWRCC